MHACTKKEQGENLNFASAKKGGGGRTEITSIWRTWKKGQTGNHLQLGARVLNLLLYSFAAGELDGLGQLLDGQFVLVVFHELFRCLFLFLFLFRSP